MMGEAAKSISPLQQAFLVSCPVYPTYCTGYGFTDSLEGQDEGFRLAALTRCGRAITLPLISSPPGMIAGVGSNLYCGLLFSRYESEMDE
jgi:hypothetical protein